MEKEYIGRNESICHSCFHSCVCEQFNEHKESHNKKCHFYISRYVNSADVVKVVRCEDCTMWDRANISCEGRARCLTGEGGIRYRGRNDFCSTGVRMDRGGNNK